MSPITAPARPSCAAARLAASGNRQSISAAVAAGLLAVGDDHGGAGLGCMELIAEGVALAAAEGSRSTTPRARIVGRGARAAASGSPASATASTAPIRAPRCSSTWRARGGIAGDGVAFVTAMEQAIAAAVKPLPINIDGALAAVLHDMGFAPAFGRFVFLIGRVAGLTAEVAEELTREKPMRIRIPVAVRRRARRGTVE